MNTPEPEVFTSTELPMKVRARISRETATDIHPSRVELLAERIGDDLTYTLLAHLQAGPQVETKSESRTVSYDVAPRKPWDAARWLLSLMLDASLVGRWIKWRHALAVGEIRYKETTHTSQHLCPHGSAPPDARHVHQFWVAGKLPAVGSVAEWDGLRKIAAAASDMDGSPMGAMKVQRAYYEYRREMERSK